MACKEKISIFKLFVNILNNDTKQFIKTEDYFKAELSNKNTEWFSCLITSDHKIQIGDENNFYFGASDDARIYRF